jgi:hypothetical protein
MADHAQKVLEQTLDAALERGVAIIAERHSILSRIVQDGVSADSRDALTLRFVELGRLWHLLTAPCETQH